MIVVFVILAIFVFVMYKMHKREMEKFNAAINCIMAMILYKISGEETQERAISRAIFILKQMGFSDPEKSFFRLSEYEMFSILALSFYEIGISPPFSGESWAIINRPITVLIKSESQFRSARNYITDRYKIDVTEYGIQHNITRNDEMEAISSALIDGNSKLIEKIDEEISSALRCGDYEKLNALSEKKDKIIKSINRISASSKRMDTIASIIDQTRK